jgi:hypothetical protein
MKENQLQILIAAVISDCKKLGIIVEATACGGISLGSTYSCTAPVVPGVNQRLLLGNLDDISSITYSSTPPTTIIENITMKQGKAMFAFQGVRQSLNPQYELVPGTTSVGYNHTVNFLAFQISQAVKDNLEKLGLEKVFSIIENKNAVGNENNFFECYGLNVGLEASSLMRIPADQESGGAFTITLNTPEAEGKEPKMPQTFFKTSYAATLALVNALLTPAP